MHNQRIAAQEKRTILPDWWAKTPWQKCTERTFHKCECRSNCPAELRRRRFLGCCIRKGIPSAALTARLRRAKCLEPQLVLSFVDQVELPGRNVVKGLLESAGPMNFDQIDFDCLA